MRIDAVSKWTWALAVTVFACFHTNHAYSSDVDAEKKAGPVLGERDALSVVVLQRRHRPTGRKFFDYVAYLRKTYERERTFFELFESDKEYFNKADQLARQALTNEPRTLADEFPNIYKPLKIDSSEVAMPLANYMELVEVGDESIPPSDYKTDASNIKWVYEWVKSDSILKGYLVGAAQDYMDLDISVSLLDAPEVVEANNFFKLGTGINGLRNDLETIGLDFIYANKQNEALQRNLDAQGKKLEQQRELIEGGNHTTEEILGYIKKRQLKEIQEQREEDRIQAQRYDTAELHGAADVAGYVLDIIDKSGAAGSYARKMGSVLVEASNLNFYSPTMGPVSLAAGYLGIVSTIASSSQKSSEHLLLEQLMENLEMVRQEMHHRFDIVDLKLDTLLKLNQRSLSSLLNDTKEIRTQIIELEKRVKMEHSLTRRKIETLIDIGRVEAFSKCFRSGSEGFPREAKKDYEFDSCIQSMDIYGNMVPRDDSLIALPLDTFQANLSVFAYSSHYVTLLDFLDSISAGDNINYPKLDAQSYRGLLNYMGADLLVNAAEWIRVAQDYIAYTLVNSELINDSEYFDEVHSNFIQSGKNVNRFYKAVLLQSEENQVKLNSSLVSRIFAMQQLIARSVKEHIDSERNYWINPATRPDAVLRIGSSDQDIESSPYIPRQLSNKADLEMCNGTAIADMEFYKDKSKTSYYLNPAYVEYFPKDSLAAERVGLGEISYCIEKELVTDRGRVAEFEYVLEVIFTDYKGKEYLLAKNQFIHETKKGWSNIVSKNYGLRRAIGTWDKDLEKYNGYHFFGKETRAMAQSEVDKGIEELSLFLAGYRTQVEKNFTSDLVEDSEIRNLIDQWNMAQSALKFLLGEVLSTYASPPSYRELLQISTFSNEINWKGEKLVEKIVMNADYDVVSELELSSSLIKNWLLAVDESDLTNLDGHPLVNMTLDELAIISRDRNLRSSWWH